MCAGTRHPFLLLKEEIQHGVQSEGVAIMRAVCMSRVTHLQDSSLDEVPTGFCLWLTRGWQVDRLVTFDQDWDETCPPLMQSRS